MVRCVTFLFLFCIVSGAGGQVLIDYVIAVVNEDAITRSELDTELSIAAIMRTSVANTLTVAERRAVLDTIINRKLVLQESKRLGIVVTERDARVEERVAEIRKKYATDAAFQRALHRHGLEHKALNAWIYEQLVYDELFRRIFFNALNSAEIATLAKLYYDANAAEFIVPPTFTFNALSISIPVDASEAEKQHTENLTQQLYGRLEQGETFKAVHETYESQITIRLEVLTLEVDTPLGTVVSELKDAERSALISVSDGYQIVERIRRNPAYQKTYAEVSEEITDKIQHEKAETEFRTWLTERRAEESWHILDDALGGKNETK